MSEHAVLNRELRQKMEATSKNVTNADVMQVMRQVVVSVDTLSNKVDALDGKVDTLRNDMERRFSEVDARFNKVDARFNEVDVKIFEVRSEQQNMALAQQGLSQEVQSMKTTSWIVCMGTLAAMALFIVGAWYQSQTSADRYRGLELMIQAQMAATASRLAAPQSPIQGESDRKSPRR